MNCFNIIRDPDICHIQTDTGWKNAYRQGAGTWCSGMIKLEAVEDRGNLSVLVEAPGTELKRIILRWGQQVTGDIKILSDHWERGYGDLEWRGINPERILPWYFLAYDGNRTFGCGVSTGANSFCFWQVDAHGVTLCIDVRCGGAGVLLGDRVLKAAEIVSYQGIENETPFASGKKFCKLLCDILKLPCKPVYGGNNWYYAYGKSSHREILEDTQRIADLTKGLDNRPYMIIDDGWELCRRYSGCGPISK